MAPLHQELHQLLVEGLACADSKAAAFCSNLLELEAAVWTSATVERVGPTNNHIERILRTGVLWRKNSFGCHSEAGCRFVEQILTVVQMLRWQNRPVLDYRHQAVLAHRAGKPAPKLLPST